MSQLILDDQLNVRTVLRPIRRWITAQRLSDLRPSELILDERVPTILMTLKQPTFVTIDRDFWDAKLCNGHYCILYFSLTDDEQALLPVLLRALFRQPEFGSRRRRMGKVARVSRAAIDYWEANARRLRRITWRVERRTK